MPNELQKLKEAYFKNMKRIFAKKLSYVGITSTEEVGTVMIAIVLCQIHCSKAVQISLQWTDVIIQQHPAALKEKRLSFKAATTAFRTLQKYLRWEPPVLRSRLRRAEGSRPSGLSRHSLPLSRDAPQCDGGPR